MSTMRVGKLVVEGEPTGGTLKWGTIIPLIGGSSIGCSKSAGNLPAFHLTYTPFKNNETHLMRYWPKVPKYYIDKDQEPENMQGKKCCISDILKRPQNFGPSSTFYLSNKERKISQIFRATHNI